MRTHSSNHARSKGLQEVNDAAIRSALSSKILSRKTRRSDTVVVEELGLNQGQALADVVVVNGSIKVFEIKSDRDSLRRLERQVAVYGQVVDHATLVVGEKHLLRAVELLPSWWGVVVASATSRGIRLRSIRTGTRNPNRRVESLVRLLWRNDAIELLRRKDAHRDLSRGPKYMMWARICEIFSLEEVASEVRVALKTRARAGLLRHLS